MKRRDFLKTSVVAGVALSLNFEGLQAALSSNTVAVEQAPDLVAVMGGEPAVMLDKALEALGGIGKYIKKEQKANEISEDEQKDAEAEVQKLTDQFVKKIDEMVESKSKEIMTV